MQPIFNGGAHDVATLESDDDFADLDSIISEVEARRASAKGLAAKQKRLAAGISEDERVQLLAEIRRHEDTYVWRTTAAVALFHSQHCTSCDHSHRFFMGWMTLQEHRSDPNCRRYTRGRPIEPIAARIETHAQPDVELCQDCAEAALAVEAIVNSIDARIGAGS